LVLDFAVDGNEEKKKMAESNDVDNDHYFHYPDDKKEYL
jgi:hypothetical protein